jgi:spermidine synthase
MKCRVWLLLFALACATPLRAAVVFDATTPYHHIRVIDERGFRTLSFDGSAETRMLLADPSKGHFEYTEYFHMPWLWNTNITNVLMIGLGGASTQRAYQRYAPQVAIDSIEIDPTVVKVAKQFFHFTETPTNRVIVSDGRVFLRRSEKKYDVILMDAYVRSRYGSFIPYHLVTQEFFKLADEHLTTNGVVAYNVIGTLHGWRADILGAVYRTMKSVFPQVHLFPATDSLNVVLIGTKSTGKLTPLGAFQKAGDLSRRKIVTLPNFEGRTRVLRTEPPVSFARSPILTDDFAPVDGLLSGRR